MGLKAKVRYPKIDRGKTTDALHETLSQAAIDAAKTFVITASEGWPVWSGASKASFLKLASQVSVGLSISPRADAPNRIPLGIETSTGYLIISRGRSYSFVWSSDLDYIHIVEGDHGLIEAGLAAVQEMSVDLPQPIFRR